MSEKLPCSSCGFLDLQEPWCCTCGMKATCQDSYSRSYCEQCHQDIHGDSDRYYKLDLNSCGICFEPKTPTEQL